MDNWIDFDVSKTIRDFDFTKRAVQRMYNVLDSDKFNSEDADMIFKYLSEEMEIVYFNDYLKRFLFSRYSPGASFRDTDNEVYIEIINREFEKNEAPHSLTPTLKKWSAIVKDWLNRESVRRPTIFLLGFGLAMTDVEVSEFLTKVNKEEDFDFFDIEELSYWYAFKNGMNYEKTLELIKRLKCITPSGEIDAQRWIEIQKDPRGKITDMQTLCEYVHGLILYNVIEEKKKVSLDMFKKLYEDSRRIVADIYNRYDYAEEVSSRKHVWEKDEITPGDVEKVLMCGTPTSEGGNLQKMSASVLSKQFSLKRISRQRIDSILKGRQRVERYDLITLLFFRYAVEVEPDWPAERYLRYVEEINEILRESDMMEIYPVNPYEAFVLMCLVTDEPLSVYSEIWEKSYEEA